MIARNVGTGESPVSLQERKKCKTSYRKFSWEAAPRKRRGAVFVERDVEIPIPKPNRQTGEWNLSTS
jgi:hypothetical protein